MDFAPVLYRLRLLLISVGIVAILWGLVGLHSQQLTNLGRLTLGNTLLIIYIALGKVQESIENNGGVD